MTSKISAISPSGYSAFIRKERSERLITIITGENEFPGYLHEIAPESASLLVIPTRNWNRDLSPWKSPACFKGGDAFDGKADEFLHAVTEIILPEAEEKLHLLHPARTMAGYSLAGLFALYALFNTDLFSSAASVSGSLWYDGFIDYLKNQPPFKEQKHVYLSLGDREEHTKNKRLSQVGDSTKTAFEILNRLNCQALFEYNPGNHFFEPDRRMLKAIRHFTQEAYM